MRKGSSRGDSRSRTKVPSLRAARDEEQNQEPEENSKSPAYPIPVSRQVSNITIEGRILVQPKSVTNGSLVNTNVSRLPWRRVWAILWKSRLLYCFASEKEARLFFPSQTMGPGAQNGMSA